MIALPDGVTVHAGGRTWVREIPAGLCPDYLKPAPAAPAKGAKAPAEDSTGA